MNLENDYFIWLTSQIDIPHNRSQNTYVDLFTKLHNTEFVWMIDGDDNRLQDALDVRSEFLNRRRDALSERPVSILEILIALSRRVSWVANLSPEIWAWRLLENLRLTKSSDPLTGRKADRVEDILEGLIWRTYERDGMGGFFPLRYPQEDQTKKEIWDQMSAYINEMNSSLI